MAGPAVQGPGVCLLVSKVLTQPLGAGVARQALKTRRRARRAGVPVAILPSRRQLTQDQAVAVGAGATQVGGGDATGDERVAPRTALP